MTSRKCCLKKRHAWATREPGMDNRARKRNGATAAKVGFIIMAIHTTHWKRTNRIDSHGTRAERIQVEQNMGTAGMMGQGAPTT